MQKIKEVQRPRNARIKSSTNTYHVVVKGADNQLLFEDPKDYQKYMALLEYISSRPGITDISFVNNILGSQEQFLLLHATPVEEKCLDIEQLRKRTPDDVAKDIIFDTCKCNSVADFQKLSLSDRDKYLVSIHKKGVSIRQLNRLTETPRGVIE